MPTKFTLKWLLQRWKSNNYMEREREKSPGYRDTLYLNKDSVKKLPI